MFENAVHYEASNKPVGAQIDVSFKTNTCPVVSAGHTKHEYTTGYAFEEILS